MLRVAPETRSSHLPQALSVSDVYCTLSKIAIHVTRALGLILVAAGVGCIIAGLQLPAIALLVAGAAATVLGFALDKSRETLPAESISAMAFGRKAWIQHLGDPGEEPPLPANIGKILAGQCPFWPEKTVAETHILVLVPKTVTKTLRDHSVITLPLTLKTLNELVKSSNRGIGIVYRDLDGVIVEEHGDMQSERSHWVLMTKQILSESEKEIYPDQQQRVRVAGYEVPSCLEAVAAILLEEIRSGTRLFSKPWSYTHCRERIHGGYRPHQLLVGGFGPEGLEVGDDPFSDLNIREVEGIAGIVAVKKFF